MDLPFAGESDVFGGLMGMAVKSIFSAVGKQLQQASQQSAAVREQAAALIESDFRVQRALGGGRVQVGRDAISQSSSTTIINGQRSAAVTLLLPVQSSGGQTATAEVGEFTAHTTVPCIISEPLWITFIMMPPDTGLFSSILFQIIHAFMRVVQSLNGVHAFLQVSFQQSPTQEDADAELRILVRTANGQVVQINGGRGDKEGAIDVDWREVK